MRLLRYQYRMRHRSLPKAQGRGSGPQGRINKMRMIVTDLFRHERIEGNGVFLDEARGYAELVIQEAMKYGDRHPATMEMADYWILEKDVIHKLFKVLVPRYTNYSTTSTQIFNLPQIYPGLPRSRAILELKGNPWPPVVPHQRDIRGSLVNVLLREAKKEYRKKKYEEFAAAMEKGSNQHRQSSSQEKSHSDSMDHVTADIEKIDLNSQHNTDTKQQP